MNPIEKKSLPETKYILVRIVIIIAVVEFLIMALLLFFGSTFNIWEVFLDTILLAGISAPLISKFVVHSFVKKEAQVLEALEQMHTLYNRNVIASSTDIRGKIIYASEAFSKISGYSKKELLGKNHNILRHPDMPKELFEDMWNTIKSGRPWQGDIKNLNKNGEIYWVDTVIVPKFDHDHNLVGYDSIRHDITHEKAKEQFMANMSHELRTPLNSIIGFSGILKNKEPKYDHTDLSRQINVSAKSLLNLINDILDLSKIQNDQFEINPYKFNAYDEVSKNIEQFHGLLYDQSVRFTHKVGEDLKGIFVGDWSRISQIILNLMSNAIKFTSKNGHIGYEVDYSEGYLKIVISDDGIGMSKTTQDKVFKPFVQADGSITRQYGGTGLGLSITQKLVEIMNGSIQLESKEGVGTTFIVMLPLEKLDSIEEKVIEEIDTEESSVQLSGHVLVVEDNKTNQLLIKLLLEDVGLSCDVANDGLEAIDMYDPEKHRLILMDENMPNMSGIEAAKKIRQKYKESCGPIISLSANAMEGDREKFIASGMDDYVSKPIDEKKLYACLSRFLT